jgi:predicted dehydrogenase
MVGYVLRYSDTFKKAKELMDEGVLGVITGIKGSIYHTQKTSKGLGWRFKKEISGGGILIDLGIHLIDLLMWYFGKIIAVRGSIESFIAQDIEDKITGLLTFGNNLKCTFEASWKEKNYRLQETSIEIEGTLGRMKVNQDFLKIDYADSTQNVQNNRIFYRQDLYKGIEFDLAGPEFSNEDIDFINCIREEKQSQLNVLNSSRVHSVIDAIYKSAKTKQIEEVSYIDQ